MDFDRYYTAAILQVWAFNPSMFEINPRLSLYLFPFKGFKLKSMKAAGTHEIKEELLTLPPKKVLELCLRLVKYKKENKELLTYLLFNAHDQQSFLENVKKEIDEEFTELPKSNWYFTKKSLRKILRSISKYSRHTGSNEAAIEMLIHFCIKLKNSGISFNRNQALSNLYDQQLKKINTQMKSIHEDLHFDYKKQLQKLS